MTFKAVIFDLDGTLLDTIEDIADAVNAALSDLGFPNHSVDDYKVIVGAGVENLVWQVLPEESRDQENQKRCLENVCKYYNEYGLRKTKPYHGIDGLLKSLVSKGVKLAVLSNKPHRNTSVQIAHYFKEHHFDVVQGALPHVPNKPDPTSALEVSRRLGVDPVECIFLGDSDIDMMTAKSAGMYPVGALWGFRSHQELKAHGAAKLIEDPMELLELF